LPGGFDVPKTVEVREGDWILVWLPVRIVRENDLGDQVVTVEVPRLTLSPGDGRVTALLRDFDLVKAEKGRNWPEG
jgi:hypothetical protein